MPELATPGQRLSFLIDNILKIKTVNFSKRLSLRPAYLSQIRTGKKPFTKSIAFKIGEIYPNVNIQWVLSGDGEPMKTDSNASDHAEPLPPQFNEKQADYTAGAIALDDVPGLLRSLLSRVTELEERVQYLENREPEKGQVQENQKNKSAE